MEYRGPGSATGVKALILNCTLKPSPARSNTARPSSVAQRVLERMDAMLSEEDDQGRPVAYNRVAHHVISDYLDSDEGHEWSRSTGEAAAVNLHAVASALAEHPVPAPSG